MPKDLISKEKLESKLAEVVVGRDYDDLRIFGTRGTIFLGKHLVGIGEDAHLTTPVLLDVLRPHVIVICGKRGCGKCLSGDSVVLLSNGSCVPIAELEKYDENVMSLGEELKIKPAEKQGFYKRNVNKLLKIRLRSGREIKLTPEHPLLTIKGWKPASELGIGNRIATPRCINVFGNESLPDYKIKLLAYFIAERRKKGLARFTNSDEKIIDEFKKCVEEFDKNLTVSKCGKNTFAVIDKRFPIKTQKQSHGNSLISWLEKIGVYDKLSRDKILPDIVFRINEENMRIFLNRLFSCGGSIYKTACWEISYSSSSKKMIHQIQHLLLRFGIISKIRERDMKYGKKFKSYEIIIVGENVDTFIKEIGFFGKKEEKQKLVQNMKRNPNVDTIPQDVWDLYKSENDKIWPYGYVHPMREFYSPSRQKLLQIARIEQKALRLLAESDIFWDEIVSMELLEGDFVVYDISVPEYHNFVANDIIVHNSYSLGVIAEEFIKLPNDVKENLCALIIDTQGIFWTMKSPNEKDLPLLAEWELRPQGFPIFVYVPEGQEKTFSEAGVEFDGVFSISANELTVDDWLSVFDMDPISPLGILLQRVISKSIAGNKAGNIDDIIENIRKEKGFEHEKLALENLFETAKTWGIFGEAKMPEILEPGKISIIDVSLTPQNVRSLLIALTTRKIFIERTKARRIEELAETEGMTIKRTPLCWILIDEAHNFIPDKGNPASLETLLKLAREGRQPGISLVLATQRPNKLHTEVLAQCDLLISHRLTAKADIESLKAIMQTYMIYDIAKYINDLPKLKGVALILDDNSERLYTIKVRPRQSWHAGASPVAI